MKQINLDLIRSTEAAAIAAAMWVGSGNKIEADKAATEAMRNRLNKINFAGIVAIGEGIKDQSYGLFQGELVGEEFVFIRQNSTPKPNYDLAIDPIEGSTPTVTSGPEAISTIAMAGKDCFYRTDDFYMLKLAYGSQIKDKIKLNISDDILDIVEKISVVLDKPKEQIMVCMLDRPRHQEYINKLREHKVRIKLIKDCDVSGAIAACLEDSGVDLLYGIGGAPEAVISAAAIKCLGGDFQGVCVDEEWNKKGNVLEIEDLVKGDCVFVATGITDGSILDGVRFTSRGPITHSVSMRSESGTVRWIKANHGN